MTEPGAEAVRPPHAHSHSAIDFTCGADGVTVLARRHVAYPLHVTRPFLLAERPAGMATLYLQSVSGGLYGGDDVTLALSCGAGAAAHVTTQSPGVVHDTRASMAVQRVRLDVADGGFLEYLPEASLLFPGADLHSHVEAHLGGAAVLMIGEGLSRHDPAHDGQSFARYASSVTLRDTGGSLLLADRLQMDGARHLDLVTASDGLAACQANLYCLQSRVPNDALLDACRAALDEHPSVYAGASALPADAGVAVRMMAREADLLAAARLAAWCALRKAITGSAPAPRRK